MQPLIKGIGKLYFNSSEQS